MTLPSSGLRAVGLGPEQSCSSGAGTVNADCDPRCLASPPRATAIPLPPLAPSLWQTGCFSCRSQCSGNCPKLICDNGAFSSLALSGKQAAAQASRGQLGGLGHPGKVLVGAMVSASPFQEPARIAEEPEGRSCYSHPGRADRQTSSKASPFCRRGSCTGTNGSRDIFIHCPFRSHRNVSATLGCSHRL